MPSLDIEIVHRRSQAGDAEQISINLQAVPSLEAFSRYVESANPFAFWAKAVQMAWLPWLAVAQAAFPPGVTLPQVGVEGTTRSNRRRAPSAKRLSPIPPWEPAIIECVDTDATGLPRRFA